MHCQAQLPRTATYFDTRTQVPTTPQGREPAARRSWIPPERSGLPATASRTLGGADHFTFQPCCAAAFPSNECPQAAAPARQTCAASRRAFSGAQHLLYNSCTSVTDACPWPHRVSDALPGRAAAHCHLSDTRTQMPTTPKGASQQRGVPAAQPRPPSCQLRRSCAHVRTSPSCRGLVWAGLGRACGKHKTIFPDDTSKAERTACGSIAHAWRCRPVHFPALLRCSISLQRVPTGQPH